KPYAEDIFQNKLLVFHSNIIIYIVVYLMLTIFIGLASGLYTASFMSKLNVISILKNSMHSGNRKSRFRVALSVIQLIIFCSFVSSTLIIRSQYNFALNKNPGYYNKDILFVDMGMSSPDSKTFINSIKAYPDVISTGGSMEALPMLYPMPYNIEHPQDKTKKVSIELMGVDFNFVKTMGIQVLEGTDFSPEFANNAGPFYLINEKAVEKLGLTDPVGKNIDVEGGTIIGIVNNFNLHSFHSEIPPLLIVASDAYVKQVAIRYKPGTLGNLLPLIKSEWEKVAPDQPFIYKTIEEFKKEIYTNEKNLSVIVSISSLFCLLIASFGLFGITLFIIKSQTKKIGIKKVFGSSEDNIVFSFIGNNIIMVIIATILSIPVTIIIMNHWLTNFAFKTNIAWWVFAAAFLIAACVVLLTVSYHSYRASRVNPVEALRYE
ncbi:MAG: FtsX-like permease family protein, partial [Prolixibacteraceae bacterium]|nr:FtsX-like permease family protein [Prolixibacteraceae bacterium]